MRNWKRAALPLVIVTLVACGEEGTTVSLDGGVDAAAGPVDGAAPEGGAPAAFLSIKPTNLPPGSFPSPPAGAVGMVFDGTTCAGRTEVELDTDTGGVIGCTLLPGKDFMYAQIAQQDGSKVGVFTTTRFRIDPTLAVRLRGQLPLVVLAGTTVEILGRLDGSARANKAVAGGFSHNPKGGGEGLGPGGGKSGATAAAAARFAGSAARAAASSPRARNTAWPS